MPQSIVVAVSEATDTPQAVAELVETLRAADPALVVVFHSPRHAARDVAPLVRDAFPDAVTVGCSTMGEVGDGRFLRGAMTAIAFGKQARVAAECITDLRSWRFDQSAAVVGRLCATLGCAPAALRSDRHLFISLIDGLSGSDELLLTAIADVAPGVPLVGACAADDERFEETWVFKGGCVAKGAAILLLVEPGVPFLPFAIHHYQPTGTRTVVTRADPAHRRVSELDGWPALHRYAELCDLTVEQFRASPELLLGQPTQFGVRGSAERFLRGVMTARGDELVLAGAVEEGEILDVMKAGDLVESTRHGLAAVLRALDLPDPSRCKLLLFSCGGRYHAAEREGVLGELAQAMAPVPGIGLSTYGEHFGSLLVNYTLTGAVFAQLDESEA